jgi:hypothetical protein
MTAFTDGIVAGTIGFTIGMVTAHLIHAFHWRRLRRDLERLRK